MAVPAHDDQRVFPLRAQQRYDALQNCVNVYVLAPAARLEHRGDEFARKSFINMQGLVTMFTVISVEQTQLLAPVQSTVCVVRINDNNLWLIGIRGNKDIYKSNRHVV